VSWAWGHGLRFGHLFSNFFLRLWVWCISLFYSCGGREYCGVLYERVKLMLCHGHSPVSSGGAVFFFVDLVERLLGTSAGSSSSCGSGFVAFFRAIEGSRWGRQAEEREPNKKSVPLFVSPSASVGRSMIKNESNDATQLSHGNLMDLIWFDFRPSGLSVVSRVSLSGLWGWAPACLHDRACSVPGRLHVVYHNKMGHVPSHTSPIPPLPSHVQKVCECPP
jgi:hypothetical protein